MSFLSKIFGTERKEPNLLNPETLQMWHRVETALDRVRPMLQVDGGDIQLIDVSGVDITVRLVGACSHCPSSTMTMQEGVERVLRQEIPELKNIFVQ